MNGKNMMLARASAGDAHQIALVSLYGYCYCVHVKTTVGRVDLYRVQMGRVESVFEGAEVPVGHCGIRVVDNLLIILNFELQESSVFDVQSEEYCAKPFVVIWHGVPPGPPALTMQLEPCIEGGVLMHILFGGRPISVQRPPRGDIVESALELSQELYSPDTDICIDLARGRAYKLEISSEELVKGHSSKLESILFLLRRTGSKRTVCEHIKKLLLSRTELSRMAGLFLKLNQSYKLAAIERKHRAGALQSVPSEDELKTYAGTTVLLQSDVFSAILSPLLDESGIDLCYLTYATTGYYQSLLLQDIHVHLNLQIFILKLLIRTRNFTLLHQLVQFHVISDSKEVASILLSLSKTVLEGCFPPGFQLSLDMCKRLSLQEGLKAALLEQEFAFEAAQLAPSTRK